MRRWTAQLPPAAVGRRIALTVCGGGEVVLGCSTGAVNLRIAEEGKEWRCMVGAGEIEREDRLYTLGLARREKRISHQPRVRFENLVEHAFAPLHRIAQLHKQHNTLLALNIQTRSSL
jgi:hypothetical protein